MGAGRYLQLGRARGGGGGGGGGQFATCDVEMTNIDNDMGNKKK